MTDTTTAHTAGPWKAIGNPYSDKARDIVSPEGDRIAAVNGAAFDNSSEVASNARLIAAAPDLLEALEDMVHLFDHPGIYGLITQGKRHGWTAENVVERIGASRRAKAAIAKAKGA